MKRILAIDDEEFVLQCVQSALAEVGYDVSTTQDPATFLSRLSEESFDLVLLDVKMPEMSGFDLCRKLRKRAALPVIFITAYPETFDPGEKGFSELWKEEFAGGNTDIIYKPFELETLFEKVEGLIGPA